MITRLKGMYLLIGGDLNDISEESLSELYFNTNEYNDPKYLVIFFSKSHFNRKLYVKLFLRIIY